MHPVHHFINDESGAMTVDWVGLSASVLLLGMAVLYGVYNNGVAEAMALVNTTLATEHAQIPLGDIPNPNP